LLPKILSHAGPKRSSVAGSRGTVGVNPHLAITAEDDSIEQQLARLDPAPSTDWRQAAAAQLGEQSSLGDYGGSRVGVVQRMDGGLGMLVAGSDLDA
jgi:hypothetical protein